MITVPENRPWTQEGYEARAEAQKLRHKEVEPLIVEVVTAASRAHDLLKPHAKHVSKVPIDYPIRWCGSVALNPLGGFSGERDLSIYVSLDEGHTLSLTRDLREQNTEFPLLKVVRHKEIDEKLYLETAISQWNTRQQPYRAEVSRWKYGYVDGKKHCGDRYDKTISSYLNGYVNLEDHLAKVQADLAKAESLVSTL